MACLQVGTLTGPGWRGDISTGICATAVSGYRKTSLGRPLECTATHARPSEQPILRHPPRFHEQRCRLFRAIGFDAGELVEGREWLIGRGGKVDMIEH